VVNIQPDIGDLTELTAEWSGERFADGRPRVPDSVLAELATASTEHVWEKLSVSGYPRQFAGGWMQTHRARPLVGRAVTAQFVPHRPDFDSVITSAILATGRHTERDRHNWTLVESLQRGDVMVVDIFGKIIDGTVIGDNLGTAVASRTGAGAVIDGGVRDLAGLERLDNVSIFYRGTDPTPIADVTLAGINIPVRIGGATVLPGDVVLGTPSGVMFIPPALAAEVAAQARVTRLRDEFGKTRLNEGRYPTERIDVGTWDEEIASDFARWSESYEG
jgi:regulator of RNase E activity RraA